MKIFRFERPCKRALAALVLCLGFSSLQHGVAQSPSAVRITQKINESSLIRLQGNTPPLAQQKYDTGVAPGAKVASRLILVLARSAAQEASLQTWLDSVQDVNSANYRHWLTPDEFGKRFGVSDADLATIESWLSSHGFAVNKASPGKMSIEFSGTTAQVDAAFHTSVHSYVVNGAQHWANAADPEIPAALAPVVAGVAKLNDFNPRSTAVRGPGGVYNPESKRVEPTYTLGNATNGYTVFLGPADVATIYNTPTVLNANHSGTLYDGTGVTIGVAGDSNIDVTQNANYRATFGLPVKATTVIVDGADPGENGDAVEAYLDTQVAGGIAPNANVILYTAANTHLNSGLFLAISRAVDDNQVDILNISFGGCEANQGASGNQYIYNLWQQAAAQGISLTVSTGDSGSAGCDNENTETVASLGLAVNALSSTPYNIAVGGTDFDTLYSNFPFSFTQYIDITNTLANHRSALKYIPERPWNNSTFQDDNTTISANVPWSATQFANNANIVAAGGGFSACVQQSSGACTAGYPVPNWQSGYATTNSGRNLPDVSLVAGNGLYGAVWGLCTDQEYDSSGDLIADCAGNPTTGTNFYLTGVGGTSAAAPAFAGMLALLKQKTGSRLGQADYVLYDLAKTHYATVFHDVQTGNNSVACTSGTPDCAANAGSYDFMTGYDAASGFDEASGLGSVDASQMLSNWAGAGLIATNSSLTLNGTTAVLNITHGTGVAVNVGVTGSGGTPDGNVALVDSINPATVPNSGSISSFTLSSGTATVTTNSLSGGTYNVSAHYGGSQAFASSDSNAIPVTVSAENSTTSLTVRGYFEPSSGSPVSTPYYGYIYLIDAQPYGNSASASNPNGAATGTISFKSGTVSIGTAALDSSGVAELQTSTIPTGADSLTAIFPGDASFQANTSAPVSLIVQPMQTEVALTNSTQNVGGSANLGASVTINAKLVNFFNLQTLDSMGVAPTGTITLTDQAVSTNTTTTLATLPITGTAGSASALATGTAVYATSSLGAGSHLINASYSGDGNYAASQPSSGNFILINGFTAAMTLTPASNPAKNDQPLPVTVALAQSSNNPVPTGTVTLVVYNGSAILFNSSAASLVNGAVSITIPANTLPITTLELHAIYNGDKSYNSNAASANIQIISSGTIAPTVTMAPPTGVQASYPFSIPVKVTGPSGDATPTGSVTLSLGTNVLSTQTLGNGSTTFVIYQNGLPAGANSLTASFTGDATYTSGTGTGVVSVIASPWINFVPYGQYVAVNQPLAFSVTVSANTTNPIPAATGNVTISSGTYKSAATPLTNGSASFTIPTNSLTVGTDDVTATYSGDANYLPGNGDEFVNVSVAIAPGITLSGSNVAVAPGAVVGNTSTLTVVPTAGFTGSVTLAALVTTSPAGAVDPPAFSFGATSPVSITDAGGQTATLTISTTAETTASFAPPASPGGALWRQGEVAFACVLLFGVSAIRRRGKRALFMLLLLVVAAGGAISCGGGGGSSGSGGGGGKGNSNPGTTPGSYVVTVTATSGTISATTTINLIVN
jgi:subtilase family serine protease